METKNDSTSLPPVPATSGGNLLAWPANNAYRAPMTGSTPAVDVEVNIADLKFDPKLQTRAKPHDVQYIMTLVGVIKEGTLQDPIVVFRDPTDGSLWVADGHARADAARSAGCATIRARVHEGGLREAFEFALGANATHGVRRNNADLRHAVQMALEDPRTGNYTNVKIAELCHCSDHYVGGLRNTRAAATGNAPGARVTGTDGKSYPARRPRKAAVSTGSTLAITPPVAGSSPPSMNHAPASPDGGAGSGIAVTEGVPAEASHDGRSAEVTSLPRPERRVHEVLGVVPVEQTAPLPGDSSHAVTAPGEGEPATVPTGVTEVSDLEVIPSITTPLVAMVDLLQQILTASKQVRTALPNLGVPHHLVSEVREEAARLHECLRDHGRPTDAQWSARTTSGDRFRSMMGYNPRPGHASDEAILGVLAAEMDQERLSA